VALQVNGQELKSSVQVKGDVRTGMSAADYATQYQASMDLLNLQSEVNTLLNNTEQVINQLKGLSDRVKFMAGSANEPSAETKAATEEISKAQKAVEALRDTWRRPPPAMSYRQKPQLREEIRSLLSAIGEVQAKPTQPQLMRIEELRQEMAQAKAAYAKVVTDSLEPLNKKYAAMPMIIAKP
jgi:peptidoglycan hydrolase CwlO-like protein